MKNSYSKWYPKQTKNSFPKAHGNVTLHGSHPAVPFASGANHPGPLKGPGEFGRGRGDVSHPPGVRPFRVGVLWVSKERKKLKAHGNVTLHGSHPAVPFASGATSSTHGLRLYGSIIITIERSWRQLCGKLLMERWQESLSGIIPPFGAVTAYQPNGSLLSKRIRLLYAALIRRFLFQGTIRFCQPVKMHW